MNEDKSKKPADKLDRLGTWPEPPIPKAVQDEFELDPQRFNEIMREAMKAPPTPKKAVGKGK